MGKDVQLNQYAIDQINNAMADSNKRIHITNNNLSLDVFENRTQSNGRSFIKPQGLWYGIGNSWIDWCSGEMPHWVDKNIYEIELHEDKILKISSLNQFVDFEKEFILQNYSQLGLNQELEMLLARYNKSIDFKKISELFDGIEINPYRYERRLESYWYYGWDCASGCIWNKNAVKSIRLIAQYNLEKEKYDFFNGENL